jgi:hypothetical protein
MACSTASIATQSTAQQLGSIIKSARDIMRKDKGSTATSTGCRC